MAERIPSSLLRALVATLSVSLVLTMYAGARAPTARKVASTEVSGQNTNQRDHFQWKAKVPSWPDQIERHGDVLLTWSGGNSARLRAFPASCGHRRATCRALWHARERNGGFNDGEGFTVHGDTVYLTQAFPRFGGIGKFPLHCSGNCRPTWFDAPGPIRPAHKHFWPFSRPKVFTKPVIAGGVIYSAGVAETDLSHPDERRGRLYAFPEQCPTSTGCQPLWESPVLYGIGPPSVRDGRIFTPSASGLYVFPVGCRTDGGVCEPLWHAIAGLNDFGSMLMLAPAFAGAEVFVSTAYDEGGGEPAVRRFLSYPMDCRTDGGVCRPRIRVRLPNSSSNSALLVHDDSVFMNATHRGILQFTNCAGREPGCRPRRTFGEPNVEYPVTDDPVEAPGIFVGDKLLTPSGTQGVFQKTAALAEFDASCPARRCRPVALFHPRKPFGGTTLTEGHGLAFVVVAGSVVALDPDRVRDHRLRPMWSWKVPAGAVERLVVDRDTLYVSAHHTLYAVRIPQRLLHRRS